LSVALVFGFGFERSMCRSVHPASVLDVDISDLVEIRVYELRWFERKRERVGSIRFRAHDAVNTQSTLTVQDNAGDRPLSVSIELKPAEEDVQFAQRTYAEAADSLTKSATVNKSASRARDAINAIQKIGETVTQFVPVIEPAIALCTQTWEIIRRQERCDALVVDLIETMSSSLMLLASIEDYARMKGLQGTVTELMRLVEDASRFVIGYKSNESVLSAIGLSRDRHQVHEFVEKFETLTKEFDRGMVSHLAQKLDAMLSDSDRILIDQLIVPGALYNPSRCCLTGTRAQILDKIEKWAYNNDGTRSFLWLHGPAGSGKSSIASSAADCFVKAGILAGSFFCKRDNELLRNPENVVSSLAASLAQKCPPYGAQLVMALRKDKQLAESETRTRFSSLFVNPILELGARPVPHNLIVIVDAIDECGTNDTRKEILRCLLDLSQLSSWIRVLVTSRSGDEFRSLFASNQERIERKDLFAESPSSVTDDITLYIRHRMSSISRRVAWPNDFDINQLVFRSNNLFIWARIACDLIEQSFDPEATLEGVLAGKGSADAKRALDEMYATALTGCVGNTMDGAAAVRLCVGAIVLTGTRCPLPDDALASILGQRVSPFAISRVVDRLGSVLYRDKNGCVRVIHQSFSDYMVGEGCPEQYRINTTIQNTEIAISCLELMVKNLRYNICGLEDSRIMNRDVLDLTTRIEDNISPELAYGCQYWAGHLVESPSVTPLLRASINYLLDEFITKSRLLYWVEVLSLMRKTAVALVNMAQLIDWTDSQYTKYAIDMYRFISAAYVPISSSTPHLYVSALPFGAANYDTIRKLKLEFPNTLSVSAVSGLWNVRCLRFIEEGSGVLSVAISPDGQRIIAGGLANLKSPLRYKDTLTALLRLRSPSMAEELSQVLGTKRCAYGTQRPPSDYVSR
ncbi:hypothetical protein FRC07_010638, partial [Ceratobasidium sp. 392]